MQRIIVFCFAGAVSLMAQQDLTVQWKASLEDLEQRLAGLPADGGAAAAGWRADAEALRTSMSSFASSNTAIKLQVPDALPESANRQAMTQQLSQLNDAASEVIRR